MTPEQEKTLRQPFPPELIGQLPKAGKLLDFVGHGPVTDRLLQVDPGWSWEPMGFEPNGSPAFIREDGHLILWGRLTVGGVTRPGVGVVHADKEDAHKEVVSDFLKNAAMRFGVALDLWIKEDASKRLDPAADAGTHEAIRSILANLSETQSKLVAAWWKQQRFPSLKSGDVLTQQQAEAVLNHLDTLEETAA